MTNYSFNYQVAQEGQISDSSLHRIDSATAIPGIDFGKAVSLFSFAGTNDMAVSLYNNTREVFGVTGFTMVNSAGVYNISDRCSVLSFGRIYVKTEIQCYPGDPAYLNNNPVGGVMGNFTPFPTYGAGVGETNRRVGTFLSHGPDNGIVILDFAPWIN